MYKKIQNYGLPKNVFEQQVNFVALEALGNSQERVNQNKDLLRGFVEVSLYGYDNLTLDNFSSNTIKLLKEFNLKKIDDISLSRSLDSNEKIEKNLERFDTLVYLLARADLEIPKNEIEFNQIISDFEMFLENYYDENLLPVLDITESEIIAELTKIYSDQDLTDSEKEKLAEKFLEGKEKELSKEYKDNWDNMSNRALQDALIVLGALNIDKVSDAQVANYNTGFRKGYLSNILGNIGTFFRQVQEQFLDGVFLRDNFTDSLKKIKMNRNNFKLSLVSHPRSLFRAIISKSALKNDYQYFKMVVPNYLIPSLKPSGVTKSNLFKIKTADEWSKQSTTNNVHVIDGLGLHHNSQDYYLPIKTSEIEKQKELSKDQRKDLNK